MTILQEPIKAAVLNCLNHYAYADAIFLAERLYAEVGTSDALFLLATAFYQSGKPKVTVVLLEGHVAHSAECKLLYAQCFWDLRNYAKVEQILTSDISYSVNVNKGIHSLKRKSYIATVVDEIQREFRESACFALSLLGRTYLMTERLELAEHCLQASLRLNPLQWVPFKKMCEAGKKPDPSKVFATNYLPNFYLSRGFSMNPQSRIALQYPPSSMDKNQTLRESESDGNYLNTSNVLRTRQLQNRTDQQQSDFITPPSTTTKSGQTNTGKSQALTSAMAMHLTPDSMVTPPSTKQDLRGTSGGLKSLPSSAFSQKAATVVTPECELLRSTPSCDQFSEWDDSIQSITNGVLSSARKSTRTQLRIGRGLMGSPSAFSPIAPSFGISPLADTPSPTAERVMSMVTPTDVIQHPEATAPIKKMITRQSRKTHSSTQSGTGVFGKLHFSSENSNRCLTMSNANNTKQLTTPASTQQSMPVRRSTRIFANAGSSIKENNKNAAKTKHNQSTKRTNRPRLSSAKSNIEQSEEVKLDVSDMNMEAQYIAHQRSIFEGIMKLMRDIGQGYLALCQYDCRKAISHFINLPPNQRNTGWVLSLLGRAHFELNEYNEAADVFEELRTLAPYYCQGLDIYSTTLWHMKKEMELSSLAHDMKELDHLCPETWCAIGNCFSLQRDHSSAASFFHRAIQLDPQYSYAYTLLGHEMASMEDLDGALSSYRSALRWNARQYNAWYGIGTIYYKQEKYKSAELHFRKSLEINPHNSVLLCHIGIVQHALKQTDGALQTLDAAVKMSPRNPLCKFHRANVLIALEKYDDAASELKELKEIVPKESLVHFLLGKVYKKLKQNHLAVISFSWAMDLDPKGANNHIKEAIDRQHLPDDDDDGYDDDTVDTNGLASEISQLISTDINDSADGMMDDGLFHRRTRNGDAGGLGSDNSESF